MSKMFLFLMHFLAHCYLIHFLMHVQVPILFCRQYQKIIFLSPKCIQDCTKSLMCNPLPNTKDSTVLLSIVDSTVHSCRVLLAYKFENNHVYLFKKYLVLTYNTKCKLLSRILSNKYFALGGVLFIYIFKVSRVINTRNFAKCKIIVLSELTVFV